MPRHIRPIRIEGNIAYVPLTQGYEAVIDAADLHLVEGFNWYALKNRNTVYAVRNDSSGPKPRRVRMHRVILGEPIGLQVDHEDGNGLNNRRKNLRAATNAQNQHNQRIRIDNASGFKGVSFDGRRSKWRARIMLNGKNKYLGLHNTPEQAHAAYCAASAELHGQFGRAE